MTASTIGNIPVNTITSAHFDVLNDARLNLVEHFMESMSERAATALAFKALCICPMEWHDRSIERRAEARAQAADLAKFKRKAQAFADTYTARGAA
jgi:hypothetical protein